MLLLSFALKNPVMNKNQVISIFLTSLLLFSCNQPVENKNNYTIKGSDSELELIKTLIENAEIEGVSAGFSVQGGGSGTGLQALIENQVDVANSSRIISDEEYERAKNNGVTPVSVIVAMDAIAMITNSRLGIDSLSVFEVRDILSGKITNWKEVGGIDTAIVVYGRDQSSGTRDYIRKNLLKSDFASGSKALTTSTEIIRSVKNDLRGIGYVSVGTLVDEKGKPHGEIWATYIYLEDNHAYSPYEFKAVERGSYPLTRPLYQYFNGWPQDELLKFVEFELSPKGQEIIRKNGYFPITDVHRHLNDLNRKNALGIEK